jgi:DNA uptake protein and related DNA-binding proteins
MRCDSGGMATSSERKALVFFGIVIALGTATRIIRLHSSTSSVDVSAREALDTQLSAADSARHAKFGKTKARHRAPRAPAQHPRVDLDVAGEAEIEALRGVGPSLARRIVAERDSFGPFGSFEGLKRVRGVGPALVAKLDSTVTFSLLPRPMNTVISSRSGRPVGTVRHRPNSRLRDTLH